MYALEEWIERICDSRQQPRIPTARIVRCILLMLWTRMGSLHAMDRKRPGGRWRKWIGGAIASDDRLGDVAALMHLDGVRELVRQSYVKRRRNKSLPPLPNGLRAVIFDGHETPGSYHRSCRDCLTRQVKTKRGKKTQYYHCYVAAMLLYNGGEMLLDVEPQRRREGEAAAAMRLLLRLLVHYPRAFNVVAGDALYADPDFCKLALARGKDFIAVLKNENRDLLVDARSLCDEANPCYIRRGKTNCKCWDIEGFTSWSQVGRSVRVVCSVETTTVRRQRTKKNETQTTEWFWVTSLSQNVAPTRTILRLGHGRWSIENNGFNELVNKWHADHIYKHDSNAILAFVLLTFAAYNIFHAMILLNFKLELRQQFDAQGCAQAILADFFLHLGISCRSP